MALNQVDLKRIQKTVGLFCHKRYLLRAHLIPAIGAAS